MFWGFLICYLVPIGAIIVCRGTRYAFPLAVVVGVPILVSRMLWLAVYTASSDVDFMFHASIVLWSGVLAAWYGLLCLAGGSIRIVVAYCNSKKRAAN